MDWLFGIFGAQDQVTPWQECARAVLVFAYGFAAVRLVGRRVFGKWAALDIVVSIIIGSNLSRTLTGSAPLAGTLAATTLLLALHWLLAQIAARSKRLGRLIEGRPTPLVEQGRPARAALLRWSVSESDLAEALRAQGLQDLSKVELMLLEPSGKISIVRRAEP
jgi:uncharacterized membrane protein YcaP (DUF421 family)